VLIDLTQSEYEAIRKELAELEQEYNKLLQEQEEIVAKDNKAKEELRVPAAVLLFSYFYNRLKLTKSND
jgi:hypothetical protein